MTLRFVSQEKERFSPIVAPLARCLERRSIHSDDGFTRDHRLPDEGSFSLMFLYHAREERADHGIVVLTARGNRARRTARGSDLPATIFFQRNPAGIFINGLLFAATHRPARFIRTQRR